ncbi:MAG TPA: hypothetical protein PJ992_07670 [Arachnia sp.]|nr:hypothetical protein [Arachnia sp.]
MLKRQHISTDVTRLLDAQAGVVLISQLLGTGLTRDVSARLASSWARLSSGLYLAGPPSFDAAVWAGILRAGPDGVAGSAAAAHLSGALRDPPEDIVVWSPHHRSPLAVGDWRVLFRRGR